MAREKRRVKKEGAERLSGEEAVLAEGPARVEALRWVACLVCSRKSNEVSPVAGAHIPLSVIATPPPHSLRL